MSTAYPGSQVRKRLQIVSLKKKKKHVMPAFSGTHKNFTGNPNFIIHKKSKLTLLKFHPVVSSWQKLY